MTPVDISIYFIAFSFLFFGLSCLFTRRMKKEFRRYRLSAYRQVTGILQLVGSVGLLIGWLYSLVLALSALAGLSLLMVAGVAVRIRIRDPWPALIPALFYALLCAYLFLYLIGK